jgi:hypothetical protein
VQRSMPTALGCVGFPGRGLSCTFMNISPTSLRRSVDDDEVEDINNGCNIHAEVSADSVSSDRTVDAKNLS